MSEFTTPSKNPQGRKWVLRVFDGFCVRFDGFCVRFAGVFGSTFFSVNSVSCVCFCSLLAITKVVCIMGLHVFHSVWEVDAFGRM